MKAVWVWVTENRGTLIGILIALGVLAAILTSALTAVCGGYVPLPKGETCAQCVREWTGALSGWIAGAAAIVTITYLHNANKIQQLKVHEDRKRILEIEHLDADKVRRNLENRAQAILDLIGNGETNPEYWQIWRIRSSKRNVDENAYPELFKKIKRNWQKLAKHCTPPQELKEAAKTRVEISDADCKELKALASEMKNSANKVTTDVIEPLKLKLEVSKSLIT